MVTCATGPLCKDVSVFVYKKGCLVPGTVTHTWGNNTVSALISDGNDSRTVNLIAKDVYPLQLAQSGDFFYFQDQGTPDYCKLSDPSCELPFLPAAPGNGVLVRGVPVTLLSPTCERNGIVRALLRNGQVRVDFDDGASELCPAELVCPLEAHNERSGADAMDELVGRFSVDEM